MKTENDSISKLVAVLTLIPAALMFAPFTGCAPPATAGDQEQSAPAKPGGVIGQETSDITEFDPNVEGQVVDPAAEQGNMFTYALEAYGPTVGKISKLKIDYALRLYEATNERYPETFEEFKREILDAQGITLPVLPGNAKYQYDVENHKLVVVAPKKD